MPIAKSDPGAGVQLTGSEPSTASVADAVKVAGAPAADVGARVTFPEVVTTGGRVSVTVIVKLVELALPEASVAVTVTVVTPSGNVEPEGRSAETVGAGSVSSVAAGRENVTAAPAGDVASAITSETEPSTGGVVSRIRMRVTNASVGPPPKW